MDIPLVNPPLNKYLEGESRTSTCEYLSIIGLLNYISGSSRPDISYATYSAARFSANPKASHDKGVKFIIKYLKGTKENGLIIYPKNDKGLKCFIDTDLREDDQRMNLTIQPQYIPVQDISLSIGIIRYYGRLN